MIWLSEQASNSSNNELKEAAKSAFNMVMDRTVDYPLELECWLPKEHNILSNSILESSDSKFTPPTGSGHIETVQKPSTTVDIPDNGFMNMFLQWSLQNKNFRLETLRDSSQDVTLWFERFELQTPGWTDETRAMQVVTLFEDDALQKFRQMINGKTSYFKIKDNLIRNFKQDRTGDIQCEFYGAKQRPDETVEKFSNRLIRYTNEVNEQEKVIMEKRLINVFVRGLVPSLKKILTTNSSNDFDELVRIAKRIEQYEREEQEVASVEANIENISAVKETDIKKSTCLICDKDNHETANCFKLKSAKDFVNNTQRPTIKREIRDKKEPKPSTKEYCSYCKKSYHSMKIVECGWVFVPNVAKLVILLTNVI